MPQATADLFASPCLQFKGSMVPLTTLELLYFDPEKFSQALQEKIRQAPNLFKNLPLVLSLDKFAEDINDLNFLQIRELCSAQNLQLIGVRATDPTQIAAAESAGLAVLQPSRGRQDNTEEPSQNLQKEPQQESQQEPQASPEAAPQVESPDKEVLDSAAPANGQTANRIIRTPIRSGQQVYAPGGDLIVMAPVSAGAEILADGNIHVYGPLRGRALAGVRGNTEAMVFCQSLEAELVSIAGQYKISEDLQGNHWKKPSLLKLEDDRLVIREL
ncbi:septum site-determining protein MinC [Hahella sp. CCB-MM4]|uniref:septum site-determining protein MinC n=1 Tax=Hahella sp. (strain CCB-MM4) TaxID=1926491 RepID=UPI000B9B6E82|nr:septum site-determining protein MinC [Hahella sp. CCB-MM4]OZG70667.1 septum site-determining protein MinC [Hahella sp. CCB-MM4]